MKINLFRNLNSGITRPHSLPAFAKCSTVASVLLLITTSVFPAIYNLENSQIKFEISSDDGSYKVLDKKSGVVWESNPQKKRFGEVVLMASGKRLTTDLSSCTIKKGDNSLEMIFLPLETKATASLKVIISIDKKGDILNIAYDSTPDLQVERINLLDNSLWVRNDENGYLVIPVRQGLIIPSNSGLNFEHSFGTYTYEGCHMAMFGIVKNGAAALINWNDPYTTLNVKSVVDTPEKKRQILLPSLILTKSSKTFQIKFLGKGGYVEVGKAYRDFAAQKGWLVSWDKKLKEHPGRKLLFGAANIKLWSLLSRQMNEDSSKEISKRVNWTFDEAAQVAEHIKNDLKIDKVLFTIGGWIHRGYDNQHPDILPAAPECGGNEKLAECARRVMKLGYLFCLHDNYQDIYRDSPSWNEDLIMKNLEGKLVPGGVWAGGRAYLTCSLKALELARRPQNLPAVKDLTKANSYFIDTTYAAGLYECFDYKHPLTRHDDMKWKQALSDYARSLFGIFGSECGREWAIPHSDFFEGLTGVSGRHYHDANLEKKVGGFVIPLFEIVYRNCIAMYGKYGYNPDNSAEYVLDHIIYARPLNYHNVPSGIYWKNELNDEILIKPAGLEFKPLGNKSFEIAYLWECEKAPKHEWRVFVHFTDTNGKILFQNDHQPVIPVTQWKPGKNVTGPFKVVIPEQYLNQKVFNIRIGMFNPENGRRGKLSGVDDGELRFLIGNIKVEDNKISFESNLKLSSPPDKPGIFVSANNGWAEGLHSFDRFLKNTCEILNPFNEITSRMELINHEFLSIDEKGYIKTPTQILVLDRRIQRSVFGYSNGVSTELAEAIINASNQKCIVRSRLGGEVVLPGYGFLIESPHFIAFNALRWNGLNYESPTLFTIRSLDGKPINTSSKIRIYHGFGADNIKLFDKTIAVKKEEIITR